MQEEKITQAEFMAAATELAGRLSMYDGLLVTLLLKFMDQSLEEQRGMIQAFREDYDQLLAGFFHRGTLLGQRRMRILDLEQKLRDAGIDPDV